MEAMKTLHRDRTILRKLYMTHKYYKRSGLYKFLLRNLAKLAAIIAVIVVLFVVIEKYVIDLDLFFKLLVETLPTGGVLILFFISESILGLIPPDLFILWGEHFPHPYLMITILAFLSYGGGIVAYELGRRLSFRPKIAQMIEKRFKQHFTLIRKWGGVFIVFSALLPLPFAAVSTVAGAVKYPFSTYMFFGLTRILRFYLYAIALFLL